MSFLRGKIWGACFILTIALLSSCRSLKNTNTLFQSEYDKFADTAKSIYIVNPGKDRVVSDYIIQPYDLIALKNLQNPEGLVVSATDAAQSAAVFRVSKEGIISLPVIGQVSLKGLTQELATAKIQELYGKTLLKNPIIELTVVNYKVTLLGEVTKAGNYQIERENFDLIELIGKSGGLMSSSNPRNIKIIRNDRKNPEIIYVNLKNIKSLASDKLVLRNNDIIYVPSNRLHNITEGIKSYSSIVQPAILILNALILINTLR